MPLDSLRSIRPRSAAPSRHLSTTLRRAAAAMGRAHGALVRRWQMRRVLDLDDRLLADIGLTRLDVEHGLGRRRGASPADGRDRW